jgi:hypothetical protein
MEEFETLDLGISPRVFGRHREGTRVKYQLWNNSDRDISVIPEEIVLRRHRARSTAMRRCQGDRLPPGLWRAVDRLLAAEPAFFDRFAMGAAGAQHIRDVLERLREPLRAECLALPEHAVLARMMLHLGPGRVHALVTRHRETDRATTPGVPDLILFEQGALAGRVWRLCFVEVKRPDERLAPHQAEEIRFLRQLGLEAGVFRLVERGTPQAHAA